MIIENESEYKEYVASLRKRNDESFYKKYTNNNVNLDDFDKIINDYITTHNEKFNFYFLNCEFKIDIYINFTTNRETNYFINIDSDNINSYLLYYIDCFKSKGYNFYKFNQMTINSISDRCNMAY